MGTLASSIFGLVAGDPTKKEENQLGALGGYETGLGEADTTAASNYDLDLLSGDPSKIATALAPEISAGQEQVQQQRNQNAQFGSRSGGNTASTASAEDRERGNIINLTGDVQGKAAQSAGSLGTNLLSQATPNINDQASLARAQQTAEAGDIGGVVQGAAQIASLAAGGFGGTLPDSGGVIGASGGDGTNNYFDELAGTD